MCQSQITVLGWKQISAVVFMLWIVNQYTKCNFITYHNDWVVTFSLIRAKIRVVYVKFSRVQSFTTTPLLCSSCTVVKQTKLHPAVVKVERSLEKQMVHSLIKYCDLKTCNHNIQFSHWRTLGKIPNYVQCNEIHNPDSNGKQYFELSAAIFTVKPQQHGVLIADTIHKLANINLSFSNP